MKLIEHQQSNVVLIHTNDNYVCDLNSAPPPYQETTVKIKPIDYTNQKDYLCFSIFNLIFCGFFLGLPALLFSVKAREKFRTGRIIEGQINAKVSRTLNICAVCMGLIFIAYFFVKNYDSIINNL